MKTLTVQCSGDERARRDLCQAHSGGRVDRKSTPEDSSVTILRGNTKEDPGTDLAQAPHYHLIDHEWVYILSGSGHLRLINTALPVHTNQKGRPLRDSAATRSESQATSNTKLDGIKVQPQELYDEEFRPISAGDFAGFMGGVKAGKYAHSLVAGEEGMTYLMGGTRKTVDICSYPM